MSFAAMILLPGAAAAQKSVFIEGLKDLERAMLQDPAGAAIAVDKMAAGLDVWERGVVSGFSPTDVPRSKPPADASLLGEESSATPMLPLAAYAEGFQRVRVGDYRGAVQSWRQAAAVIGDERPQLAAAGKMAQDGRDVDAERALLAIIAARPHSGVARWWLARIYERLNRISDARREYETVASMALTGRAPLYEAIGRLAYAEGDFARATDAYQRRVQLTPEDTAAYRDLARVHAEQGRTDDALRVLSAAIAIDPRDAQAHASIGRIHLDGGRPADAIPSFQRAIALVPALFEARYPLALALSQTGRREDAARELELFERGRRASTDERRRAMSDELRRQESVAPEAAR
jgi:tetratricopeptide (TPR) repeat protein